MRYGHLSAVLLFIAATCLADNPSTRPASTYPALQRRLAKLEDEIKSLTTENSKLRGENAELKAKASALSPQPETSASSPASPTTPDVPPERKPLVPLPAGLVGEDSQKPDDADFSIESLNSFAKVFVPLVHQNLDIAEKNESAKSSVNFSLKSTDMVKTDSVLHPVVAKMVCESVEMREAIENVHYWRKDTYELKWVKNSGKWVFLGGSKICDYIMTIPEIPIRKDGVGKTEAVTASWISEIFPSR